MLMAKAFQGIFQRFLRKEMSPQKAGIWNSRIKNALRM
jgi:hypothetical protein